ncbi:MAG: protein kinase [Bryobacterales bacterium]|nr:protein kinase [Bryobacterales bacterium]
MALERIGNYEVLGELGRGGMGVVYRGVDSFIKRPVAIKTIYLSEIQEDHERQFLRDRLYREAQSAGILSHPNIVTIYQIGEQDDITYIVMEFVEGKNLAQVLRSPDKPSVELLLSVFEQTAAGLDHAHAQGVVHRDIKPANIIVRSDGVAKITDFGVAKITSQTVTRTGMTLGTPHFMAPEQIQGKPVDGRADQYALGVVIYEIFTGRKPFTADSMTTLIFKIVTDAVDPKRDNPNLSDAAAEVLKRALAKEAADRFPSCQALVEAFRNAIGLPSAAALGLAGGMATPTGIRIGPATGSAATPASGSQPMPGRSGMAPALPVSQSVSQGVATGFQTPTPTSAPGMPPIPTAPPAPVSPPAAPPRTVAQPAWPSAPAAAIERKGNSWLFPAIAGAGLLMVLGIFFIVWLIRGGEAAPENKQTPPQLASTQGTEPVAGPPANTASSTPASAAVPSHRGQASRSQRMRRPQLPPPSLADRVAEARLPLPLQPPAQRNRPPFRRRATRNHLPPNPDWLQAQAHGPLPSNQPEAYGQATGEPPPRQRRPHLSYLRQNPPHSRNLCARNPRLSPFSRRRNQSCACRLFTRPPQGAMGSAVL